MKRNFETVSTHRINRYRGQAVAEALRPDDDTVVFVLYTGCLIIVYLGRLLIKRVTIDYYAKLGGTASRSHTSLQTNY